MFKRFKTRYYSLTLISRDATLDNPTVLFGINCDLKIKIRGKVSREIILKMLSESKDEYIQETFKKFPFLIAWSEVDSF